MILVLCVFNFFKRKNSQIDSQPKSNLHWYTYIAIKKKLLTLKHIRTCVIVERNAGHVELGYLLTTDKQKMELVRTAAADQQTLGRFLTNVTVIFQC